LAAVAAVLLGFGWYWHRHGSLIPHGVPDGGLFPYWDGVFSPHGFCAEALVPGERPVLLDLTGRVLLSVLGCVLGAALYVRAESNFQAAGPGRLLLVFTLLQVPVLLAAPRVYDRYLLFLLPGALSLAGIQKATDKPIWSTGLAALTLLAGISVCLTHDLWSWNAARWQLGQEVGRNLELDPTDTEGGFEWDGWFAPHPRPRVRAVGGLVTSLDRFFFPYVTGRYALSFSPMQNTKILAERPYWTWLPPAEHRFYFLRVETGRPKAIQR
jgi:hypothetical protein